MKKSIFIILLISFVLTMTSCSTGENHTAGLTVNEPSTPKTDGTASKRQLTVKSPADSSNVSYEIIKQTYAEKNIKINYPQITNLSDKNKQHRINEIIKNDALSICNYPEINNQYAKGDYEIKWQSGNLLSIIYTGSQQYQDTPHPNNKFNTTNIDINKGIKLRLKDLINIDETFVEKVRTGEFVRREIEPTLRSYLAKYISDVEMTQQLSDIGYFYFTEDSLVISIVDIPHAIGDHMEIEVRYVDIKNTLKVENEAWEDFFK